MFDCSAPSSGSTMAVWGCLKRPRASGIALSVQQPCVAVDASESILTMSLCVTRESTSLMSPKSCGVMHKVTCRGAMTSRTVSSWLCRVGLLWTVSNDAMSIGVMLDNAMRSHVCTSVLKLHNCKQFCV